MRKFRSKSNNKKDTYITIDATSLTPVGKIPHNKHHRVYWHIAMVMCGRSLSKGTLEEDKKKILDHLLEVRKSHMDGKSWIKTINNQLDSAYEITERGKNNLFNTLDRSAKYYKFKV